MQIESIELYRFIPTIHGGITRIKIDLRSPITCLIGNNGSGKSSIMRELQPFPPAANLFKPGGYKIINITHDGSRYTLTSTKESKVLTHSFIKDDVELNDSGTVGVQNELVRKEFGITDAVKQLMGGVVKFCKMPVSQRKKFLMACYPSDLTFMLEHHKYILGLLRGNKSNVKMINDRINDLEYAAIPEEAYKSMLLTQSQLVEFKTYIGKVLAIYNSEFESIIGHPNYDKDAPVVDFEELQCDIGKFATKTNKLYSESYPYYYKDNATEVAALSATHSVNSGILAGIDKDIVELVQEIDRFEQLSEEVKDDQLAIKLETINTLKAQISSSHVDASLPIWEQSDYIDMNFLAQCSASLNDPLLQEEEHATFIHTCKETKHRLDEDRNSAKFLDSQRLALVAHIASMKFEYFNGDCVLACQARDNAKHEHTSNTVQLAEVIGKLETLNESIRRDTEYLSTNSDKYTYEQEAQPIVTRVMTMLEPIRSNLDNLLDEDLGKCVRSRYHVVFNLVTRVIENSVVKRALDTYKANLSTEELILTQLVETKQEKQELLDRLSGNNTDRLSTLKHQHATLSTELRAVSGHLGKNKALLDNVSEFATFDEYVGQAILTSIVNRRAEWIELVIVQFTDILAIVEDEQLSIRSTIKEQESIRIRIDQELKPSLAKLLSKQKELSAIEQSLSPTVGIPNKYIKTFVNQVISHANVAISQVWNYQMEVLKLEDNKNMDFTFPVGLYDSGEVPDLNLLSDGQSEIVDLALTWAVYRVRKFGKQYPIKLDEVDKGLVDSHRAALLTFINDIMSSGEINQLLLVNHHNSLFSGLPNADIVVLDANGIVLPQEYNTHVEIT